MLMRVFNLGSIIVTINHQQYAIAIQYAGACSNAPFLFQLMRNYMFIHFFFHINMQDTSWISDYYEVLCGLNFHSKVVFVRVVLKID